MTDRERVVRWPDPAPGVAALPSKTGLEYLRAIGAGELPPPPMASHFDLRLVSVEPGTVTFSCEPDESHYNPIGSVHGGLVCTLLDSAIGCAVQTTLPAGTGYTSIEIKINYLRPVTRHSGPMTCVATVTKPGSRVAFADAVATDNAGRAVASASGSALIFPLG